MRKEVNIYVEGRGDLVFLCAFLKKRFDYSFKFINDLNATLIDDENISISVSVFDPDSGHGGIDSRKIRSLIDEIKDTKAPLGIESVILLDSDTPEHENPKGGFSNRKAYLDNLQNHTPFKYFLIPDNSSDGNLEILLEGIIGLSGKPFFECLKNYVACLCKLSESDKPTGVSEISDFKKTQMEWYTYMMLGKKNRLTGANRDYSNELWDLKSLSLDPLYRFLDSILNM